MLLRADFREPIVFATDELPWVDSPMPGVRRRRLDRIGDEVARATSIVRYEPGSAFSAHTHGGGEEFYVLDGTFRDEHGTYPAGSYVRNPPGSRHTPSAPDGCVLFVKLWQMDLDDQETRRVLDAAGRVVDRPGERVRIDRWAPTDEVPPLAPPGGLELFVLGGSLRWTGVSPTTLGRGGWIRLPGGTPSPLTVGPEGAHVYLKTGRVDGAADHFRRLGGQVARPEGPA
ncbi:MAG: cupin domain-containing protein [Myxococcota bacterium]